MTFLSFVNLNAVQRSKKVTLYLYDETLSLLIKKAWCNAFFYITLGKQMSNYYAPCFYKIGFVVIPSYIELPWSEKVASSCRHNPTFSLVHWLASFLLFFALAYWYVSKIYFAQYVMEEKRWVWHVFNNKHSFMKIFLFL